MSDEPDPEWQEILRIVDELMEELKSCALAGKAPCGCVFVGIVDKEGRARLFPVHRKSCLESLNQLPQVEAAFWKKRTVSPDSGHTPDDGEDAGAPG